ncbi:integrase core domain-containing protein [Streptomyces sp. NPDC050388]|uniref:integrase core domain-containing protein n=1 Tax=Streptomyces sp. NPDC050388 TaxID=3155781 RepID=UPI0034315A3B
MIRDRDAQDTGSCDTVFAAEDITAGWTAPRAPGRNAPGERGVGALRREVLDHLLIWNETRARRVLNVCARHDNCHRPHRARGRLPPSRGSTRHPRPI